MNATEPTIHLWNHCHHCGQAPIEGTRYECQTCPLGPDADFCAACHALIVAGTLKHPAPDNLHARHTTGEPHSFLALDGTDSTAYLSWLEVPLAPGAAPVVANGSVLRPEFCCGYASSFASYSFVVTHPTSGRPVLLTALHVMDELLRKQNIDAHAENPNYTGTELPALLTHVNLYDVFAANWMLAFIGKTDRMLVLPNARIRDPEPRSDRDIAAFAISQSQGLVPLNLAQRVPEPGESVWLAASFGRGHAQRCFKAVTVAVADDAFVFRFEDERKGPPFTSGAPILNAAGEVVAINVGGGRFRDQRFGHGNHVGNLRKHLETARSL